MDYTAINTILESPKTIAITAHKSPDGDAIGSTLALYHVLLDLGHNCRVIVPDAFPKFLNWMKGSHSIMIFDEDIEKAKSFVLGSDVVFCLDYNNLDRVGELGEAILASSAKTILIDHHLYPDTIFDFALSHTSASSTAELVYDFLNQLQLTDRIDVPIAQCLYAGIMTDTGSFRFSSTTAHTHEIVASLMNKGLEPTSVHQSIYDTNSISRLRLTGYALSSCLEVVANGKAAIIPLSLKDKNRFGYVKGDTEGLVNYGLSIDGVEVAVLLSEELNLVKFSFRSKGRVNVNEVARASFNGGGHRNAAGGKLDVQLDEAKSKLIKVLEQLDYE
ncbi:MAG: bifunctional oligoribonuclease/PAP phosphatase NrnA [Salibacteraceae bacterium]